ncbi:VP3 [Gokushovirinae sp.]|nr:VP3 [Gokushovirinae sp.]
MKFCTQFSEDRPRPKSVIGSRVKKLYSPVFDKNGRMELEETGQEDLYGYIQSHKDSVDIHVILDRYQRGDVTALNRAQAFYVDATSFPKTYAEALQRMQDAHMYFDSLPVETRAKFGHDFNQFLASLDKPDFAELLGFAAAGDGTSALAPETVVDKEVKNVES